MLMHKRTFRNILCTILLLFSIFIPVASVGSSNGFLHTSYYASDYNILNGTYLSGTVPSSVTDVDADYFIMRSVGTETSVNRYNPSEYAFLGSTSWVSGSVSNLSSNDGVNIGFRSYFSGSDIEDYIDNNTSDVDSSADKGTQSDFLAQQYGPDSIYDTLKEENTSVVGGDWGITSSAFTSIGVHSSYRYMGGMSPDVDNMTVTKLRIRYSGTGTVAIALYTGGALTDPTGATKRTEAYNVAVSTGWNEIDVPDYDWGKNTVTWIGWCHGGGGVYYSSSSGDAEDFQSARGRWNQDTPFDADETSSMPGGPGFGSFSSYWYAVYVEYEASNYEIDLEVQWTNIDYDEANEELAIYVDKGNNTNSLDATGGYMIIGDGTPDWGSTTGTISFWIQWDSVDDRPWGQHDNMETRFSGTNLVADWGVAGSITSSTSFTPGKWYFIAIVWDENTDDLYLYVGDEDNSPAEDTHLSGWIDTVSNEGVIENNFMGSKNGLDPTDGHGDDLRYWNIDRTLVEIQSDYNIELTGSETNLRSYFKLNNNFDDKAPDNNDGSGSGSYSFSSDVPFDAAPTENIQVDVWNGATWQNLFTDLTSGWNNVSVSSYLDASTFTMRLKGSTETGDTAQDTWNIDCVLLHTWTNQYIAEVEFAGFSNTYSLKQLNWTIDSAWTIGSVDVTVQLYNYTLENYPTSGSGYIAYTSSSTANTDETKNQLITSSSYDFRNSTGGWKIKVKGIKNTDTRFDFKADLIELKPTHHSEYIVSTEFLFSSMTSNTPTQLNFTVVSQSNISSVDVAVQIWNYSSSTYATSGEGNLVYTSFEANETKTLSININSQFYTSNGNAKIKITGVFTSPNEFQQEINQVKLLYGYVGVNSSPLLDPLGHKTVDALTLLTFTVTASDSDGDPLTFSLGPGAPTGASITADGVFTWTPTEDQDPGNYTIRVVVSDGSLTDYEDILVTVLEVQSSSQPFDWLTVLLYALPVIFGLLFLFVLIVKRKKKIKPHIEEKTGIFSQEFGMTHEQIIGKKMLLEIDPTSTYHKSLFSFVSEVKNRKEPLSIFTSMNSTLHSAFSGSENVDLLLLTSKASSSRQINEKETLLPASDLSVLLDACVRIQKTASGKSMNVLFDNLSDIILRCGFEKTYKFTRLLLEALSSSKTTALFIFNPAAHDLTVSSSFRGLFRIQLAYTKRGPKVKTF